VSADRAAPAAAPFSRALESAEWFVLSPEELAEVLVRLAGESALAVPVLAEPARAALLCDARTIPMRRAQAVIGEGERAVYQDFEIAMPLPDGGLLNAAADAFEALLDRALVRLDPPPLARPVPLNDRVLQRYAPGSRGITAHRDHRRYAGLVVILKLSGDGSFGVAEDRQGRGARTLEADPGHGIFLRAPGFAGGHARPFHYLTGITSTRYSLGLRHDTGV